MLPLAPIFRRWRNAIPSLILALSMMLSPERANAWGEPHLAITKAALATLPDWQKAILGAELAPLGNAYCMIPDYVYSDKANARYAAMDSHPGEVYLVKLHLPDSSQLVNLESMRYFIGKAVAALQENKPGDAARYMGTICHFLEDFGSPSHTIPGDNQFTLLQQFLPPTEKMENILLHAPVENGTFAVSIAGYQPQLLGTTVDEAAWRLLHRAHEVIINARGTTIPIIQAVYADDEETRVKWQLKAAEFEARVVADALHTIFCLAGKRFEPAAEAALAKVDLSALWPTEAVNLYYPQKEFFSSPYWGFPRAGSVLNAEKKAQPIKLRVPTETPEPAEKTFPRGLSVGVGRTLTWHLPKGTYRRFNVWAGLQSGLGEKGHVKFTILGDGKPLATTTVAGTAAAQRLDCDISQVSELKLTVANNAGEPKQNYAIWAEPVLAKE